MTPLQHAISSSRLGEKLFGWCEAKALAAYMEDYMYTTFKSAGVFFSAKDYNDVMTAIKDESCRVGAEHALIGNREIAIMYAGIKTTHIVASVVAEARLRFAGWAKSNALGTDLELFPFESDHMKTVDPIDIDDILLEKLKEGRVVWNRILKEK